MLRTALGPQIEGWLDDAPPLLAELEFIRSINVLTEA
jgi:hypothetical protein